MQTLIRMGSCLAQPTIRDKQRGSTVQATPSAARRRPPAATSSRGSPLGAPVSPGGPKPVGAPSRVTAESDRTSPTPRPPNVVPSSYARFGVVCSPSVVEDGCCGGGFGGPRRRAPGPCRDPGVLLLLSRRITRIRWGDTLRSLSVQPPTVLALGSSHQRRRRWGDGWVVDHVQDLDPVEWEERLACHSSCNSTKRYSAYQKRAGWTTYPRGAARTAQASTGQHRLDGPRLSCKQQAGGSSPPASSKPAGQRPLLAIVDSIREGVVIPPLVRRAAGAPAPLRYVGVPPASWLRPGSDAVGGNAGWNVGARPSQEVDRGRHDLCGCAATPTFQLKEFAHLPTPKQTRCLVVESAGLEVTVRHSSFLPPLARFG